MRAPSSSLVVMRRAKQSGARGAAKTHASSRQFLTPRHGRQSGGPPGQWTTIIRRAAHRRVWRGTRRTANDAAGCPQRGGVADAADARRARVAATVVGSSNWNARSRSRDLELGVFFVTPDDALQRAFAAEWAGLAADAAPRDDARVPRWARFLRPILRPFL